jgi:hypothetical protein
MPLAFLVPAFLAGLAALAIPVLVHLRHRERREPVRFPSLMFLRRIPFREVRRQQIHHWPLFLIRVLALVLLVLAFARPFLPGSAAVVSPAGDGGREIVVLLDRSTSMGYGTRWPRAREAAAEVFAGLGRGDRASLVLFDGAPAAVTRPTGDRAVLDAALQQARPGTGVTRYAPALRAARDILAGTEFPQRELVLISDFQRTGWRGEAIAPLPPGTGFRTVDVSGAPGFNLAVVGADLVQTERAGRPVLTVTGRIAATNLDGPRAVRAELLLDGRPAGAREVTVDGAAATVTFDAVPLADGFQRGVVRIASGDSLAADDEFRFVATRERPVRIVLLEGGRGRFLRRALEISRSPRVEILTRDALRPADLAGASAVVLDDAPAPAGEAGRRLEEFVREGGGLVAILGNAASPVPAWVPGVQVGGARDRADAPGAIGAARREHPVFEPWRAARRGVGGARRYRYRGLSGDSLEVLARYDDGAPALVELAVGRGRVLLWTSALDNLWSDLPLQPMFLPLAHQMILYAARHVERLPSHLVGRVAPVGADALGGLDAAIVVDPAGERTRREPGGGGEPVALAIEAAGFYEVREPGAGGRLLMLLAANPDPDESALASFDPADLGVAAGAPEGGAAPGPGQAPTALLTAAEREREQSLWWYALAGVALLLVLETFFGNRLTGFVRSVPGPAEGT